MTEKPADHEPTQEARAADTPAAPEANPAEGGTLPLPADSTEPATSTEPAPPAAPTIDVGLSSTADSTDPGPHSPTPMENAAETPTDDAPTERVEPIAAAEPIEPATAADEPPTSEFGAVPPPSDAPTSEFGAVPPPAGGPAGPPPPPPGGYLPPFSGFPPPPPPNTGGVFATRYGLVRPQNGRWFGGVCAAIGRATNTDPVLWRVLLAVLALFGGVGILIYAVGWLLIPAEGDSASPAEALIGRGQSSTSALFTLGLAVLAVIMFGVAFSGNVRTALLGGVVIAGAVLLVTKGKQGGAQPAPPPAPTPPPPAFTPAAPTASNPMNPTSTDPTGGYRPPFAPHGPFASSSPYAGYSAPYPGLGGPVAPPPPKAPRKPRERSRLGRVVLSLICLAIGTLVVVDVAGASIAGTAYVAAALGVIGLGLVVGAWIGRARWLIFPGLILSAILVFGSSVETWNSNHGDARNVVWTPASVTELNQHRYSIDVGSATLDLSKVDFVDHDVTVDASLNAGDLTVILPPNVDAVVDATVQGGSASVLGQSWDGINHGTRHITDQGADGQGGGTLHLTTSVDLGQLEVHR